MGIKKFEGLELIISKEKNYCNDKYSVFNLWLLIVKERKCILIFIVFIIVGIKFYFRLTTNSESQQKKSFEEKKILNLAHQK